MSDDAEFEAFLKGEGALSRQLKALDQPSPTPALDAAILASARAAMGAERPTAANDAAPADAWKPASALSWRWRVPAGIAATLLVGLVARQSFESDRSQVVYDVPAAEAVLAEQVLKPAPNPAPVAVADQPAALPAQEPVAAPKPSREYARTPAPVRNRTDALLPAEPKPTPAPAPVVAAPPPPAPMPAPAPAAPAPAAPAAPAAARIPADRYTDALERVTVSGSRISAPTSEEAAADAQRSAEQANRAASVRPAMRARSKGINAADFDTMSVQTPALMLEKVERLLAQGDQNGALAAWEALRRTYPDYPVPDSIREQFPEPQP